MVQIAPTTWLAARRALDKAIEHYIEDPDVAFIDLGFKTQSPRNAELAVRIHRHCQPADLAAPDLGFPVEVVESNFRFHLRRELAETAWSTGQELAGGDAISNGAGRIFTLGGKVRDRRTGEVMLLSCWHVLADAWARDESVLIYHPAVENQPPEMLAEFTRSAISRGLDAAVSRLKNGARLRNEQRGLGQVTGVALPMLGMRVQKSGSGSGVTSGVITGILGCALPRYANQQQLVGPLICITPENPAQKIGATGDSGAWWLESATQRAVALHFAGGEQPNFALAFSMPEVLEALEVEIDTTIPPAVIDPAPLAPPEAPEKIAAAPVAPEPQPVITAVKQVDAPTDDTAVLASTVKDVILAADLEVFEMDEPKSAESLRGFIWMILRLMAQRLAGLPLIPARRAIYLLAKVLVAAGLVMTMLGFDRRITTEQEQREKQIAQLHKQQLLSITEIARIDSARRQEFLRLQEYFRIVAIIDRYNPKMKSELKFALAAEIYAMSQRYPQLEVELICAVITHESKWNSEIVSHAAAMGLMQITPPTGEEVAKWEGIKWTTAEDILFNPIYNVRLGCSYLDSLISKYGLEGGLAGYNGGSVGARRYLQKDNALHPETEFYVPQVMKQYREFQQARRQETMGVMTVVDFPKG